MGRSLRNGISSDCRGRGRAQVEVPQHPGPKLSRHVCIESGMVVNGPATLDNEDEQLALNIGGSGSGSGGSGSRNTKFASSALKLQGL